MLKQLYIVIVGQDGETAHATRCDFSDTEKLEELRSEPFLLNRLITEAELGMKVKAEIDKPIPKGFISKKCGV